MFQPINDLSFPKSPRLDFADKIFLSSFMRFFEFDENVKSLTTIDKVLSSCSRFRKHILLSYLEFLGPVDLTQLSKCDPQISLACFVPKRDFSSL